jgi:hypothetical protein
MAFALLSRSRSKTQGSVKPVLKRKFARGQHSAESHFGVEKSVFQPRTAALPTAPMIQTKLKIGEPNDKFEQEADRVADMVMRMPDNEISGMSKRPEKMQRKRVACASGKELCPKCAAKNEELQRKPLALTVTPLIQRQPVDIFEIEEDEEKDVLRAKNIHGQSSEVTPQMETRVSTFRGGGQLLPWSTRAFFEPRFGCDFSQVRIHTGTQADQAARALNAYAFTVGRDIVFKAGHYAPDELAGRRLLAHELAHTIQQGASSPVTAINFHTPSTFYGIQASASVARPLLATKHSMLQKANCNFFVYDSTESGVLGTAWEVGTRARALKSWGGYAIASGTTTEIMLERILRKYDKEDCDCTEEIQFWSHGSSGNAMYIKKTGEEFTIASFNIPGLDKYGHLSLWTIFIGASKLAREAQGWYAGLTRQQKLLMQLRDTICGPSAEVYYRSCEAFRGKTGQEFAKASTRFWRSKVIGHTKIIGLTQPGKKVLKPGEEPY